MDSESEESLLVSWRRRSIKGETTDGLRGGGQVRWDAAMLKEKAQAKVTDLGAAVSAASSSQSVLT